jgi:hypothetical protein
VLAFPKVDSGWLSSGSYFGRDMLRLTVRLNAGIGRKRQSSFWEDAR